MNILPVIEQFWQRSGTTLSPLTSGDNISTSGTLTLSGLTATRIPYVGVGGLIQDSPNLTFDGLCLGIGQSPVALQTITILPDVSDTHIIYSDTEVTNKRYTGTTDAYGMLLRRGVRVASGSKPANFYNLFSSIVASHTNGIITSANIEQYPTFFSMSDSSAYKNEGASTRSVTARGNYTINSIAGSYTSTSTGRIQADILSIRAFNNITSSIVATGGATNQLNAYGIAISSTANPTITGACTVSNYGIDITLAGNTNGTSTNYGLFLRSIANADTNWGIYDAAGADHWLKGNIRIGGASAVAPTVPLDVTGAALISTTLGVTGLTTATGGVECPKSKLTTIGGYAVKLTNKTGGNSVAGQLVKADTATNDAVILTAAGDVECFGVFLDAGIADGAEAWVVVSGIADVAFDDNVAAVRGDWVSTGAAGYAATGTSPAAAPTHFEEIGHCIESVSAGGAGTHILARCILHFN